MQNEFEINLVNPHSERSVFIDISNETTKNSLNSVKTSEEESQREINLNLQPLSDEDSSYGSIEKIENYLELKSLQVNLKANHKLVFCKLDVSKDQQDDFAGKMDHVRKISDFIQQQSISRNELISKSGELLLPTELR
jgi:hypothetical protein